ncbi:MAG: hypothetical protein O3A01_05620 [bacterium]|nr:hypothetical protein [bacterium]
MLFHPDRANDGSQAIFPLVSSCLSFANALASNENGGATIFTQTFGTPAAFQSVCVARANEEAPVTWEGYAESTVVKLLDVTDRTKNLKATPFSLRRLAYVQGDDGADNWDNPRIYISLQNLEFIARAVSYSEDKGVLSGNDSRARQIGLIFDAVSLASLDGRAAVAFESLRLRVDASLKEYLGTLRPDFKDSGIQTDVFLRANPELAQDSLVNNFQKANYFLWCLQANKDGARDAFIGQHGLNQTSA